jgi:thiamine biosynthesis protein ThiS
MYHRPPPIFISSSSKGIMQSESIAIFVNGQSRHVPANQSVASLLANLEIHSERVAIELDKAIVRKRDWDRTIISGGARLEIVEFVGGG